MAEMERFEARLAASLERLADEVPVEVDAAALTAAIASAEARPGWLRALFGARGLRLAPTVRVALVVVAVLALAFGMIVLAQRVLRSPLETTVHGRMACTGPSWVSGNGAAAMDCTSELPDPRLAGDARIALGAAVDMGGVAVRQGTMELEAADATWRGTIEVTTAPNAVSAGDAALEGSGGAAGIVLHLHLLSAGETEWGLLGWVETDR